MNRRDAISRVALLMGGTIIGAEFFLSGCAPTNNKAIDLNKPEVIALLDEIADTILPATKTPGAKEAKVGSLMAVIVNDCYTAANQQIFMDGLNAIDTDSKKKYGQRFTDCSSAQRTEFLINLDLEQKKYTKLKRLDAPHHYFKMMKELTLLGYFTSEEGCTKAMRYVPVPGKYISEIPYKKGDKAWATS